MFASDAKPSRLMRTPKVHQGCCPSTDQREQPPRPLSGVFGSHPPKIRNREPQASIAALLHAVRAHQAQRVFACDPRWRETTGLTEVPEDRTEDVTAALAPLQVARDDWRTWKLRCCRPPAQPAAARASRC
ncbi:hypothetical protein ACFCZY_22515 [Streptomyces sp. NPDC056237]|uniref:hypothetical protein n=1 Tax=unclassified Streptomyces TaxID=2593676 RepID=UPI0035E11687